MLFIMAGIDISAGINVCVEASIDRACVEASIDCACVKASTDCACVEASIDCACVEACGSYVTGVQQLKCAIIKY